VKKDEGKPTVGKLVEDDVHDRPSKDVVGKNGEINTRVCFFFSFPFFYTRTVRFANNEQL